LKLLKLDLKNLKLR